MNPNKLKFWIRTNIDLFTCSQLAETLSDWAIITDGNRERLVERGTCWKESMCELFQECLRGNVLIGTLRLDKDVRFKRCKAIIKYTTGHCCSKNYIYCYPHFFFFTLFVFFLPEVKKNLISISLNCGGQHYQFKRPGDLTAPTP